MRLDASLQLRFLTAPGPGVRRPTRQIACPWELVSLRAAASGTDPTGLQKPCAGETAGRKNTLNRPGASESPWGGRVRSCRRACRLLGEGAISPLQAQITTVTRSPSPSALPSSRRPGGGKREESKTLGERGGGETQGCGGAWPSHLLHAGPRGRLSSPSPPPSIPPPPSHPSSSSEVPRKFSGVRDGSWGSPPGPRCTPISMLYLGSISKWGWPLARAGPCWGSSRGHGPLGLRAGGAPSPTMQGALMCVLLIGFKSWPLGCIEAKAPWSRHLDSSLSLLVSDPSLLGGFSAAGSLPCQFQ